MVTKKVQRRVARIDPLRPALTGMIRELEAITEALPIEGGPSEQRAKLLSLLSKTAETLSALLPERGLKGGGTSDRSDGRQGPSQRQMEVWRDIQRRFARLRAAEGEAEHIEAAWQRGEGDPAS